MSQSQKRPAARTVHIQNLRAHPEPYVTVAELAKYWLVSRKQIYKQIDAGTLRAIKLGPRLLRIRTTDAIEFERTAKMHPAAHPGESRPSAATSQHKAGAPAPLRLRVKTLRQR